MHFLQRGCVSSHFIRRALLRASSGQGGNVSDRAEARPTFAGFAPGTYRQVWHPVRTLGDHRFCRGPSTSSCWVVMPLERAVDGEVGLGRGSMTSARKGRPRHQLRRRTTALHSSVSCPGLDLQRGSPLRLISLS